MKPYLGKPAGGAQQQQYSKKKKNQMRRSKKRRKKGRQQFPKHIVFGEVGKHIWSPLFLGRCRVNEPLTGANKRGAARRNAWPVIVPAAVNSLVFQRGHSSRLKGQERVSSDWRDDSSVRKRSTQKQKEKEKENVLMGEMRYVYT